MKYIQQTIFITFLLLVSFLIPQRLFAEESSSSAVQKYHITFPIAELGNCTNITSCKAYCDDASHKDTCIAFAKKKGFYNEVNVDDKKRAMVQDAKTALGCDSEDACRAVCSQQANFDKCSAFAKKYGFDSHPQDGGRQLELLQKAKAALGCSSAESCKAVCEQEANRTKCSDFAKANGLSGGEHRVGPGGCTSEESCKAYCSNHREECMKFGGGQKGSGPNGVKSGPGGCNSEESCKKYCQEHPNECGGSRGLQGGNPEEFCKNNPDKCKEMRGNRDEFCRQNPEKCRMMNPSGQPSQQRVSPSGFKQGNFQQNQQNFQGPPPGSEQRGTAQGGSTESHSPQVQGSSTSKSLLDQILDFLGFGR